MAQSPANQSFSEPPPPYSTAEPTKAPYPDSAPYPQTGYPQPPPPGFAPPSATYPVGPPITTIVTQPAQTVTVVRVGNCPSCQVSLNVLIKF